MAAVMSVPGMMSAKFFTAVPCNQVGGAKIAGELEPLAGSRVSECLQWTVSASATPTTLVPQQFHGVEAVRDVPRTGRYPLLAGGRHHPALRAHTGVLVGRDYMHHASAVLAALDTRESARPRS